MGQTISLLNMKGGVGKTTLAVTLASHAYVHGRKRVLLVDLDPQFNASQYLMRYEDYEAHVRTRGTIADLLIEEPALRLRGNRPRPSLRRSIVPLSPDDDARLHLLPSQLALAHVVKNPAQMDYKLEKLLRGVRSDYDYVFIDCPPTDSVLTTMALNASNYILVPVKPDRFSILGFANLLQTIRQFRESAPNPNDVRELGIVFTQVREETGIEGECMREIRSLADKWKWHVFSSALNWSGTFGRAIRDQTAPFETKWARSRLKQRISQIVGEMEQRISQMAPGEVQP